MRRRADALVLGTALLAYVALGWGYATLTPIWQNPDEPAHFNYVMFVAQTGGLPELKQGDWDSALLDRLKNGQLQPGDSVAAIRYEAWQPPLFYLAAAPLVRLGPAKDDPAALVLRLRLFDALLGGITLVVGYLIARQVLARELAVAVPVVLVGVPMFTAVSAAISADPLANLLAGCLLLVLVGAIRRGGRAERGRWAFATGILLGVGLLTKLALGIFLPLALYVVMLRSARAVRDSTILLAAVAVSMLPWLVHQVTTYGWTDPLATARHASVVLDQARFPGLSSAYLTDLLTTTFHSFWAQFGWMAVVAPDRLYWTWGVLVLVGVAGLALDRGQLRQPSWLLICATCSLACVGYVGYNLTFKQFQGRYLFTALVPFAILLVSGWAAWFPLRFRPGGALALAVVLVGLNAYALLRVLVLGFAHGT